METVDNEIYHAHNYLSSSRAKQLFATDLKRGFVDGQSGPVLMGKAVHEAIEYVIRGNEDEEPRDYFSSLTKSNREKCENSLASFLIYGKENPWLYESRDVEKAVFVSKQEFLDAFDVITARGGFFVPVYEFLTRLLDEENLEGFKAKMDWVDAHKGIIIDWKTSSEVTEKSIRYAITNNHNEFSLWFYATILAVKGIYCEDLRLVFCPRISKVVADPLEVKVSTNDLYVQDRMADITNIYLAEKERRKNRTVKIEL